MFLSIIPQLAELEGEEKKQSRFVAEAFVGMQKCERVLEGLLNLML